MSGITLRRKTAQEQMPPGPSVSPSEQRSAQDVQTQGDGPLTVHLQLSLRHRRWLEQMVELTGHPVEKLIDQMVRAAYARDSTKGGTIRPGIGGGTMTGKQFKAIAPDN